MPPVFDGHNDALTESEPASLVSGRAGGHLDLPRMRAGGMRGGIFSIFTPSRSKGGEPVPRTDGVIEFALAPAIEHEWAAAFSTAVAGTLNALERDGQVRIARQIDDFDRAFAGDGPPLAVLHLEGAEAIDPELRALYHWYAAGLRSLGPVWSRPNAFGHGVPFVWPSTPDTGPGLTEAGKALVRLCAELGILVDLSHLNELGFWDVARIDPGPLVATHSAAYDLCNSSRNLTDAQLDAIASSGGLVGIVFGCFFLREDFAEDPDTPIELIAEHARYVADRIGVEHVALGSDFDGTTIPAPLGDVSGLPRLFGTLGDVGFTTEELEAIAWRNWRRVLDAWWRD